MEMAGKIVLTKWDGELAPSISDIEEKFGREGLIPSRWSNGPGDRYRVHDHSYHKVLYCAKGSIEFISGRRSFELAPGDRLDIAPGTPHSAIVGDRGVTCLEASR